MTIRQITSTVFALSSVIVALGFTVGCAAPEGIDLQAKDWGLHVPIGTAKFEAESGGFSLSKLKAEEIQNYLGDDFEGEVYDGKLYKGEVYDPAKPSTKRIFVNAGAGNNILVDGNEAQTYLVHYPVPLGIDEVKDEMNESFNESLDTEITQVMRDLGNEYGGRTDGFLEEPPIAKAITIPIKVNTSQQPQQGSRNREAPEVIGLTDLVYHVKLTFKPNGLPKTDQGTGDQINSSNRNSFLSWVKFGDANAASIILPGDTLPPDITLEPNQIIWVSNETDFNEADGDHQTILSIKFDLYPKFNPSPLTRGILYKPDLDVHDFDTARIKFANEKKEHLGSTGAFNDIITMLGGAEFEYAWMYLFTNAEIDYLTVYAEDDRRSPVNIFSGAIQDVDIFDYKKFYGTTIQTLTNTYSTVKDLTEDLLCKGAPKYELYYRIPADRELEISGTTQVDVAILIPLQFKVDVPDTPGPKDAVLVTGNETNESGVTVTKQYIKLYVEQLDDMFGSEADSFNLKDKTKDFGSLKKATADLKVKNNVLPDKFKIGLQYRGERDITHNRPLYGDVVDMKDDTTSKVTIDDVTQDVITMPRPALLLESEASSATFKIEPVEKVTENGTTAEQDISVRIIGDIVVDFNYSL